MVLMSLHDSVAPRVHLSECELDDELILDPNDNIHLRGSSLSSARRFLLVW
jgi:hypothetical protein